MARAAGVAAWRPYTPRHSGLRGGLPVSAIESRSLQSQLRFMEASVDPLTRIRFTLRLLQRMKVRVLELEVAAKQARR